MKEENKKNIVRTILESYEVKEPSRVEELKKLDRKAKRPAQIFGYTFGVVGALVLGAGMCLAMKVLGDNMLLGIIVGCLGIAMVSVNYPIFKKIEATCKKKYSKQILALSTELLSK